MNKKKPVENYIRVDDLLATYWKKIIVYVLPKSGGTEASLPYKTIEKIQALPSRLDNPWTEYF